MNASETSPPRLLRETFTIEPAARAEREGVSRSRRRFLRQASGLTAAAAATSAVGLASLTDTAETTAQAGVVTPMTAEQRRLCSLRLRQLAAQYQADLPLPIHISNADDDFYASKIASFTKAFPHNNLGEVNATAYQKYQLALATGNPADFEAIPLGGTVKLANPQAAYAFDLEGADAHALTTPPPPRFETAEEGAEMIELYWHALLRDVPFSQYGSEPLSIAAVGELRNQPGYGQTTAENLFRGEFPGDQIGPYISQFLWKPVPYGATMIDQRYRVPFRAMDFMTTYGTWLNIQNGATPADGISYDATLRYIRNGRDLGEYVHLDFSYQAFLNAALILLGYGLPALDDANPYKFSTKQGGFSSFGGPNILDLVARVANKALRAVWYQKWAVHRRVRPEEFGGRVHNHLTNASQYPIPSNLLNSNALAVTGSKYGSYLLPMAYAEGCPTHPAYPSGHAAIAGACVTVLKAFFKESYAIPNPIVVTDDGLTFQPYGGQLTIGGELNKLASNISIGRDFAGVHWRSDAIQGMLLGEAVALSVLSDFNGCLNEKFPGFSLTRFDGTQLLINAGPGQAMRFARGAGRL